MRCIFLLLLLAAATAQAALECALCHRTIAASYALTAHARASSEATSASIAGPFDPGRNVMRTRIPEVYFLMEQRDGRFYQTGIRGSTSQTERFDLVIGSGRRGQSYLYWKNDLLFQLPVSYHAGSRRWINSPGYEDGSVHFGRGIPPECLNCHATRFRLEHTAGGLRYAGDYSLGIECSKCHGEAGRHEAIIRPSGLDLCARCHSGLRDEQPVEPDVHGNQVGLLKSSRCFQRSGTLSCSTCHDVHRMERSPEILSSRCGVCHQPSSCPTAATAGESAGRRCVECHMPVVRSKLIEVQTYRTHRIAVYKR